MRVVIADDHPLLREGLAHALAPDRNVEIVGEFADGRELLANVRKLSPDVVILDVTMPGPGFQEVIRRIKARSPRTAILILSMHAESDLGIRALRAGASGYVSKAELGLRLRDALYRVAEGGRWVGPVLAERLIDELSNVGDSATPHEYLSAREFEVLCGLGAGRRVAEIASELSLSPKTVSTYRARVLAKLGLSRTAELVRYATVHGLV